MKKKIVPLLLACAFLLAAPVVFQTGAQDAVVLPSWICDFSTSAGLIEITSGSSNLAYTFTDGSHITLTALGGDPQLPLTTPSVSVGDADYLCIEYRTENTKRGEIYISRSDGVHMGETPESALKWQWETDGEWHRLILHCDGWADAADVEFTRLRFDPIGIGHVAAQGETIDIRFISFFTDEQSAKDFDLAAYQEHVSKYGPSLPEGVTLPSNGWDEPDYVPSTPHPDDNYQGTLNVTYSEDGKYATISYGEGENAVSYTVPNTEINLFGGFAGTDDLGRSLLDASTAGVVSEDHDVGILYYLWHGEHGDNGALNMQEIIDSIGVEAASDPACELWGQPDHWHHWNQPLYGYYYIDDNWVMRKHVELLTNAGIDFLYFDATDGFSHYENALKLMAVLHDFNSMGYDAPKVVFYTNTNAQGCVQEIYERIYKPGFYRDTWYMQDGKPLIVCPDGIDTNDFFTVKRSQWPTESPKENSWPLMDYEWPQHVYQDADKIPSAINVSVAQNSGTARFSDSALYGNKTNLGRSFWGKVNSADARNAYYLNLQKDPNLFVQGLNFQAQWDRAIEANVPFVLVTGWNEWLAQRQNDMSTVGFAGCASNEFSRDIEMMKGGYFDNYYMQLAINIQRLKGAAPVIVQDARNAVNVTGDFDVWDQVIVTYTDPIKDMLTRNSYGYGNILYHNETGRNDIAASKVTADTKNLYFYVQTRAMITKPKPESSWMQLLLNVDCDAQTGWYGYDYVVNYSAKDQCTTTVARYNGNDNAYSFEVIGEIGYHVKDTQMMLAVPLEMLGIDNPNGIKFEFKWVDSNSEITTMEQFYTDGDAAPLGRLNYVFQNCIDPAKAAPYIPGGEQISAQDEPRGCKAMHGSVILLACLAFIPLVFCSQKKKY